VAWCLHSISVQGENVILDVGNKLLIVHRRLFENDSPRFFIGTLDGFEDGIAKVTGHSWIRDSFTGAVFRKEGKRTKIFSIIAGTVLTYQLPDSLDLSTIRFDFDQDGRFWLLGHPELKLDLSETEHTRGHKKVTSIG
jgi:hypothetical protein